MVRRVRVALALILSLTATVHSASPKVVITSPDNGEIDVDPTITEIRVEYDQPMSPDGMSILGGGPNFPQRSGQITWANPKTLVMPVTLKPDQQYRMNFNSDTNRNFQNARGESAEWYPLRFKTRAAGAAPAEPDVTPEQNKDALAELKRVIDEEYSYRDRKKVDWAKEIEKRRAKFEAAKSANEFARLTTHLLRLAEDAHVTVEAGDVRLGTHANSAPPNFDVAMLNKAVPGWKEHATGIITGRFDDGIGYILFSNCSKQQAFGFDAVLAELKDAKALVLDVRMNAGGDELAARRVAGRFIEESAVYSKNRLRGGGNWKGPFDRVVEPRKDAERYEKPVAVLIGPKVGSSAESFVLMMKHGAGAKLIGGVTKGSSGRPMRHQLGNGVTVYLSSWEDQLPDGTVLEGRGIRPDTVIKTTPEDFESADPVLDAALKLLRRKDAQAAKAPAQ
ncbi:MAG: S41 family peptidase [Planctomycetota bacterium]|nr:S41 family peptidase [Planctomycetota bacterium]